MASSPKVARPAASATAASEWTTAEQLVLVEAVQRFGAGVVPDFTGIGRAVRQAMSYPGAVKRDHEFYAPRKCENKWREILLADDAKKGGGGRTQRKTTDPTPSERAGELVERLRDARKAELKAGVSRVEGELMEVEKELAGIDSCNEKALERYVEEALRHPEVSLLSTAVPIKTQPAELKKEDPGPPPPPSSSSAPPAPPPAAAPPPPEAAPPPPTPAASAPPPPPPAPAPAPEKGGKEEKGGEKKAASPVLHKQASKSASQEVEHDELMLHTDDVPLPVVKKRQEVMMKVWKDINGHDKAEPFKKPVTKREAPDYHTVIKKPMCLNDVKKKLDKNEYEGSLKEFSADMHLIFANAMIYNQKGSEIWAWAKELKEVLRGEEKPAYGDLTPDAPPPPTPKPAGGGRGGGRKGGDAQAATPAGEEEEEEQPVQRGKGQGGSGGRGRGRAAKAEAEEEEEEAGTPGAGRARSRRSGAGVHPRDGRKRRREDD